MKRGTFQNKPRKPMKRTQLRAKPLTKRSKLASKADKTRRVPKRLKDGSLTKAEEIRKLKKKLWPIFSKYVRKSWADHEGYLTTVDGVRVHWKECDCGHWRHNTERNALLGGNELWYYPNNFAPQSNQGNRNNADDSAQKYSLWIVKTYGIEEADKMMKMRQTYKLWTTQEIQDLIVYYTDKFNQL